MSTPPRPGPAAGSVGVVADSVEEHPKIGIGQAHAKVILLGEHAVVYDAPALAIPLPQLTVTARAARLEDRGADTEQISFATADGTPVPDEAVAGLKDLVIRFREIVGAGRTRLGLRVESMIPPGRGLGASAACARAAVLALADLFDRELDADTVFELIQTAEIAAHGKASGIDALATGTASPIRYLSGSAHDVSCGFDAVFVVADSGASSRTKDAIEHVRRLFDADPATKTEFMARVTDLTRAGVSDFTEGRPAQFGARLSQNHAALRDLGLSTDRIDALVDAALAAGGRGAKISGGGLGGCLVVLAADPDEAGAVAAALRAAGAVGTWFAPFGRFTDAGR